MSAYNVNPAQVHHPKLRLYKLVIAWAVIATSLLFISLFYSMHSANAPAAQPPRLPKKRNVIFMVSDGMGPASVAMARNYYQHITNSNFSRLYIDDHFIGNSRTRSNDSFVTDSAAGATAFSCGLKTYNGAIGVDPFGKPCASVMEAAKLAGYLTGLVVTTRITDATPASFVTHATFRSQEDFIAEQLVNYEGAHPLGRTVDLVFGGGRCHFLPAGHPDSCRSDERDLIASAKEQGWNYIDSDADFRALNLGRNVSLPLLGLFAPGDYPFTIDYHDLEFPRLNETALTAARALAEATKDSEHGFFLLVEGSRIDHCGHNNDAGAQVREVLAYSDAFRAMVEFAQEEAEVPTVVLSTSDHETGGLSLAKQVSKKYPDYLWYPEVLHRAQHSVEYLYRQLRGFKGDKDELHEFVEHDILGENGLGFIDYSKSEAKEIAHHILTSQNRLSKMQSKRAEVGWATHGHSGVDVNVYGASNVPHVLQPMHGANENTDVGHYLRDVLGFNQTVLDELTERLSSEYTFDMYAGSEIPVELHD